MTQLFLRIISASFLLVFICSCTSSRKTTYFYGTESGSFATTSKIPEVLIQKNDILNITVSSPNAEASIVFNPPIANTMAANTVLPGMANISPGTNLGYLVNTDGTIQFPLLGNIKAEGLTKAQLHDKITSEILNKKLLVDPIVTIRFLNFRVTVLGEVNRPNVLTVPNEKITLLEAIGLAGDLTLYGKRENVMIIRETATDRSVNRVNLNTNELFSSPFYYLQSNDIVYVEPNQVRVSSTRTQNLPLIIGGLGLIATVISIVVK